MGMTTSETINATTQFHSFQIYTSGVVVHLQSLEDKKMEKASCFQKQLGFEND